MQTIPNIVIDNPFQSLLLHRRTTLPMNTDIICICIIYFEIEYKLQINTKITQKKHQHRKVFISFDYSP